MYIKEKVILGKRNIAKGIMDNVIFGNILSGKEIFEKETMIENETDNILMEEQDHDCHKNEEDSCAICDK